MQAQKFNSKKHHRHSIRLKNYDYSQNGLYFITICVRNGKCLLGKIIDKQMILNELGKIANDEWYSTANLRQNVQLDAFVVMPNHTHGIINIINVVDNVADVNADNVGARRALPLPIPTQTSTQTSTPTQTPTPTQSRFQNMGKNTLSSIVGAYKSAVSRNIHFIDPDFAWQRNYYEHIIRNDVEYKRIRAYIENNPKNWGKDKFRQKKSA